MCECARPTPMDTRPAFPVVPTPHNLRLVYTHELGCQSTLSHGEVNKRVGGEGEHRKERWRGSGMGEMEQEKWSVVCAKLVASCVLPCHRALIREDSL